MHPVILRLGPVTIYSFGLFAFLAAVLASFLIWKKARRLGLPEEKVFDAFLLSLFLGLVGGRLGYVLGHWSAFGVDFSRILLFDHYPGLSFQSAFLTGLLALGLAAKYLELELLTIMDLFALSFSWAAVLGAAGCLLDGCLVVPVRSEVLGIYFLLLALGLSLASHKIDKSPDLAVLARRPGLKVSAYLIFFTGSFLIMPGVSDPGEKILYLALLVISLILFMVKFPPNVLAQIKDYLENKSRQAERDLKELKKEDPFEDKSRLLDRAADDSEAQNKFGHERAEALRQQMQTVLVQTRKALTKIKIGKYGICESCGKMIDTDRLAAMPTATKCLACEKRREK